LQTMIIVKTIMNVHSEKQREVLQTLLSLIPPLDKEEGCIRHGFYSDIENKNVFKMISEWDTRQHMEQFLMSDRFSVLLGTKSLLSEPLKVRILTVAHSEGLEAVDLLRIKSK